MEEPEWPDVHRCDECDADVWTVFEPGGREIWIDVEPMEVRPDCCGDWSRASGPESTLAVGGYSIPECVWFPDDNDWVWLVEDLKLSAAGEGRAIYSDHRLTCGEATPRTISGYLKAGFGEQKDRKLVDPLHAEWVKRWCDAPQSHWRFRDFRLVGDGQFQYTSDPKPKRHCVTISSREFPHGRELELNRSQGSVNVEAILNSGGALRSARRRTRKVAECQTVLDLSA